MKLNKDCVRNILLTIESMEYESVYTVEKLHELLPDYSYDELQYHCIQLLDAGFIKAVSVPILGHINPQISRIKDLTYQGHEFLADIRSDSIWNKTKDRAKTIGSESLHALRDIAVNVVATAISNTFN